MFYFQSVITFVIRVLISLFLYAIKQRQKNSMSGFEICLFSVSGATFIKVFHRLFRPIEPMCSDLFV